jgi:hypothetical protein
MDYIRLKTDSYRCWEIKENNFPKNGKIEDKIKFILGYGILAPSTFNSQPWKCKISKNHLDIYLDRVRITQKSDKSERFAHISIGTFLQNIIISAEYFGLKTEIKFTKHSKTKLQHIAHINFSESNKVNNSLFKAITKRSTNRSPSKSIKIENKILNEISALKQNDLDIILLDSEFKNEIISISKLGDFNIWTDIEFRKEHVAWVRTNLTRKYDGMPGFGVNANLFFSFLATPVIISPIFPKFQSKKNVKAIKSTSNFVVISSKESYQDWINVGMLFEKLNLTLINYNICASPMGQFIEDTDAKIKLENLLKLKKGLKPQIFFRIGYPTLKVPHSPRLPVDKILI